MLYAGCVADLFPEHLHATTNTYQKTCACVVEQKAFYALFAHPDQIFHGLLAAR
jgi:hypothetical protein